MSLYSKLLPDIERQSDADHRPAGGEGGIRTHGTLLEYTRSPGVPIQPALAPLRAFYDALDQKATCLLWQGFEPKSGGGRGIRTPEEPCGPLIDFESIAFVHSAIPPD
jgi:hypothetical protein